MSNKAKSVALIGAALALAATPVPNGPPRRRWQDPNNYGNERKRHKAEKANKAARKSRQRNRRAR